MNLQDKNVGRIQRRKEQILAAAKGFFARNGYRHTKIEQVSNFLDVGKGTLYRYFDGKKALLIAVFEAGMQRLSQAMRANVEPVAEPAEKVKAGIRTYLEFFDNDRELIEILMLVRSEFKDDYRRVHLAMYSDYIVRIQQNLRRGVQLGIFREIDVEKTAETISATLHGVLQSFYVRQPEEPLVDRTKAVTSLILNGLIKVEKAGMDGLSEEKI